MDHEQQPCQIEAHRLPADPPFPNNPHLPVLLYRQSLPNTGRGAADEIEQLFNANGWIGSWQNGVYPYDHYHSNAHEVLGVCAGDARIQLGGPAGPVFSVAAGDVVILPAGTAHKRVQASADFLVVGGYPAGQDDYDLQRGDADEQSAAESRITAVPLPDSDPVYGAEGPLLAEWGRG